MYNLKVTPKAFRESGAHVTDGNQYAGGLVSLTLLLTGTSLIFQNPVPGQKLYLDNYDSISGNEFVIPEYTPLANGVPLGVYLANGGAITGVTLNYGQMPAEVTDGFGTLLAIASLEFKVQSDLSPAILWTDIPQPTTANQALTMESIIPLAIADVVTTDKARVATIVANLKVGIQMPDEDSVFYILQNSAKQAVIMHLLDTGADYNALVTANQNMSLGLSDGSLLKVLSIYLTQVDPVRYENEAGLALVNSFARLKAFVDYLNANSIVIPSSILGGAVRDLRANTDIFAAARTWATTNPT